MERELYRMAAHELAAAQQQFVLLGRKTATERFASFLVLLFERTERPMAGVSGMLRLPMSRSDIADYLGLTKETVSRVISALKRERVIRLESLDLVQILDRDRLDQLSEAAA
jgi:CRP/FNR family transcriptional regulator